MKADGRLLPAPHSREFNSGARALLLTAVIVGAVIELAVTIMCNLRGSGEVLILAWQLGIIPAAVTLSFLIGLVPATTQHHSMRWIITRYLPLSVASLALVLLVIILSGHRIPNIWSNGPENDVAFVGVVNGITSQHHHR